MIDIFVFKVIVWDEIVNNEFGFEWFLMEMMFGKLVYYCWCKMIDI